MNDDFAIKISTSENMPKDKVIIICNPETKEYIENILSIAQDKLEDDNEMV
jgi:hypothetical protein